MKLKGKSPHGKNIVHQHGNQWEIIRFGSPVCFDGDFSVLIQSIETRDRRWVRWENEKDLIPDPIEG